MGDRNNQYVQSMFTNMQNSEGGFFNNNPPPKLGEKSITENGTYTAKEDKLDGYSSVTADVAGGGETFEINVTVNFDGDSVIVSDKTYPEMLAAYNANKKVIGTLTYIADTTQEYDIISWDKNNINGNNSLYIFTSVIGEGQNTRAFVLGFLETGYYVSIALGDIIPNA